MLDPNVLNRSQIIQKLKDDFNVSIQTDDPSILNKYLLSYLHSYFQWMLPDERADGFIRVRTPYYLHARNRVSRQMVEKDGSNIYFSKNAGQKTITRKFHEVMDAVYKRTDAVLPNEIQITFEYDNELYSQLNAVFLDSQDIKDFMYLHTGIVFSLEETDLNYFLTQEFTRRELLLILKQFLDLPMHIRDNLALEKIIRMAEGYQPQTTPFTIVRGLYSFEEKTIQLFDSAFEPSEDEDGTGENVLIHEIAHALWGKSLWHAFPQNLRDDYKSLSRTANEFISKYSTKNIFEDFAEHFSMYMDNPEALLHKTPKKYQWLKENVFVNTEYFSTSALDNLKIFIHSELEDINPPYLVVGQSKLTIEHIGTFHEVDSFYDHAIYRFHLDGLFDDISGIERIVLTFNSYNDGSFLILKGGLYFRDTYKGEKCQPLPSIAAFYCGSFNSNDPGYYSSAFTEFRLGSLTPGIYQLSSMIIEDVAGNSKEITNPEYFFGKVEFYFPGTKKERPSITNDDDFFHREFPEHQGQYIKDNMEVVLGSTHTEDTTAIFLLPDFLPPNYKTEGINILLKGKDTGRKLQFSFDMWYSDDVFSKFELLDIDIPRQTGFFSVPVLIPSFLPSEQYDVISIVYNVNGGGYFHLKCNDECFQFLHTTNQADHTYPKAIVEDIVLSVSSGLNSPSDYTYVLAHIPVTGFETKPFTLSDIAEKNWHERKPLKAVLRSPKGNLHHCGISQDSEESFLRCVFRLKPYHQHGEYILSYIFLNEYHSAVTDEIEVGWSMDGAEYETHDRLLRRGIRKTIKIEIPPYQEGEFVH